MEEQKKTCHLINKGAFISCFNTGSLYFIKM